MCDILYYIVLYCIRYNIIWGESKNYTNPSFANVNIILLSTASILYRISSSTSMIFDKSLIPRYFAYAIIPLVFDTPGGAK